MGFPTAEQLLKQAANGERLTAAQRRHVVGFLMATQPEVTNREMSATFQVDERMIRFDKAAIREQKAKLITQDDISLVIADIRLAYERFVVEIRRSMKAKGCIVGSPNYLNHLKAEMEMELKVVEALQNLGYYPKNLGNMTVEKYEFKSVVRKDGSVETRRADLFDANTLPQSDREKRMVLDAEYLDVPQLPAAKENGQDISETTQPSAVEVTDKENH